MFPLLYDTLFHPLERLGLARWRAHLAKSARGRVLEVGGGTGRNLPYYPANIQLVLTEPDPAMLARSRPRLAQARCPVETVVADAQRLPFASGSFDTVLVTLAFCTIPNPEAALAEIHRALRPDGVLLFLEHVRTPRSWMAKVQDVCTPLWNRLAHGCHLNRQPLEMAARHGFTLTTVRTGLDGWLIAAELRRTDARR